MDLLTYQNSFLSAVKIRIMVCVYTQLSEQNIEFHYVIMFIQLFLEFGVPLYSTQVNSHHGEEILVADTCDPQLSPIPSKCINRSCTNSIQNEEKLL